jgi:hypothetical protein
VRAGSEEQGAKSAFLGFAQVKHLFKTAGSGGMKDDNRTDAAEYSTFLSQEIGKILANNSLDRDCLLTFTGV